MSCKAVGLHDVSQALEEFRVRLTQITFAWFAAVLCGEARYHEIDEGVPTPENSDFEWEPKTSSGSPMIDLLIQVFFHPSPIFLQRKGLQSAKFGRNLASEVL